MARKWRFLSTPLLRKWLANAERHRGDVFLQIPGSHRNNRPETRRLRGDQIEVVTKTLMEIFVLLRKMEGPDDRKVH